MRGNISNRYVPSLVPSFLLDSFIGLDQTFFARFSVTCLFDIRTSIFFSLLTDIRQSLRNSFNLKELVDQAHILDMSKLKTGWWTCGLLGCTIWGPKTKKHTHLRRRKNIAGLLWLLYRLELVPDVFTVALLAGPSFGFCCDSTTLLLQSYLS